MLVALNRGGRARRREGFALFHVCAISVLGTEPVPAAMPAAWVNTVSIEIEARVKFGDEARRRA